MSDGVMKVYVEEMNHSAGEYYGYPVRRRVDLTGRWYIREYPSGLQILNVEYIYHIDAYQPQQETRAQRTLLDKMTAIWSTQPELSQPHPKEARGWASENNISFDYNHPIQECT